MKVTIEVREEGFTTVTYTTEAKHRLNCLPTDEEKRAAIIEAANSMLRALRLPEIRESAGFVVLPPGVDTPEKVAEWQDALNKHMEKP